MKRTGFKIKPRKALKRSSLRVKGHSSTTELKEEIQGLVRQIGIKRDGGCVLRHYPDANKCGGYRKDGGLVLQAEHLVSRTNSATFGDMRNIVILCKYHHLFFKNQYGNIYWSLIKKHIGEELWEWIERVKLDRTPHKVDWKLVLLDLKQQLKND